MKPAASLIAIAIAAALALPAQAADTPHTVRIEGLKFVPEELEVKAGDSVTWQNLDLVPHTVTAPAAIESGSIEPNATWKWSVRGKGRIDYVCRFHPTMHGALLVK